MLNQSMILSLLFNDEQIKCAVESQTLLTSCVVFFSYWYKDNVSLCLKYVEIKERDSY